MDGGGRYIYVVSKLRRLITIDKGSLAGVAPR